jgi:hypothetical protein
MQQHELHEARGVEDLADRSDDGVIVVVSARMDQRWRLVVDQELVEGQASIR